jgi:hypothetical protein
LPDIFWEEDMHVHPKLNPNAQLDALYASEKSAAKAEGARTRKKLLDLASELAGEAATGEPYVLEVGSREQPREQARDWSGPNSRKKRERRAESGEGKHQVSDWA